MRVVMRALVAAGLTAMLALSSACGGSKKVIEATSAEAVIAGVDRGDHVEITTRNDVVHNFTVTKITNKALYGSNARVVYEDMAKVEIKDEPADKESGEEEEEGGFWSKIF